MLLAAPHAAERETDCHSPRSLRRALSLLTRFLSRRTLLADRFLYAPVEALSTACTPVETQAVDASRLRGWLLRGERPGVIVFAPGNSGNVSSHLAYVEMARRTGHSVLSFDYRGFGSSDGQPALEQLVDDVLAACAWLDESPLSGEPFALFGISIGAGTVVAAAAERLRRDRQAGGSSRLAGLVVEGLSDTQDMLEGFFARGRFGPLRSQRLVLPSGERVERQRLRIAACRMPKLPARFLARKSCASYPFAGKQPALLRPALDGLPSLVVHGVDDALLPFESAIDFHESQRETSRLWLIPGAGHAQEPALSHGAEYVAQMGSFLARCFGQPGAEIDARRILVTQLAGGELVQGFVDASDPPTEETGLWTLPVATLSPDGWPEESADPLSHGYRYAGYRSAFRALVEAVNGRDFARLDRELEAYMALPRRMPFDLLASTYCLRVGLAHRKLVPGWPVGSENRARRALERFRDLWGAHPHWRDFDHSPSPLRWVLDELARKPGST